MPQAQQCQIRAASMTYTTAQGSAGSLTHWARPGIRPTTSWFLVRFVSSVPWQELPNSILDNIFLNSVCPNLSETRYIDTFGHICVLAFILVYSLPNSSIFVHEVFQKFLKQLSIGFTMVSMPQMLVLTLQMLVLKKSSIAWFLFLFKDFSFVCFKHQIMFTCLAKNIKQWLYKPFIENTRYHFSYIYHFLNFVSILHK